MKKILALLGLTLLAGAAASPALATPISTTLNLGTVYTGNIPDGAGPWLTATFTSNTGSTTGTLTLQANLTDSDFVKGANDKVAGWAFYLSLVPTSATCEVGGTCGSVNYGSTFDANTGPVSGIFNLLFTWSANEFNGNHSATWDLTFANPLTSSPFGENASLWSSVAHVQGITGANGQTCSGWIVSGQGTGADGGTPCIEPPTNVPEPGALGMFGLGVGVIGLFLGLRRRRFQ